jgi:hypothetical protein
MRPVPVVFLRLAFSLQLSNTFISNESTSVFPSSYIFECLQLDNRSLSTCAFGCEVIVDLFERHIRRRITQDPDDCCRTTPSTQRVRLIVAFAET